MSSRLRAIASDTLTIVDRGWYDGPSGRVDLADDVARAVAGTRLHLPDDPLAPDPPVADTELTVEVTQESTLWAIRRLGGPLAVLVFASARNPGGGFRNGAQAQEESLARASALYPALLAAPGFYEHHRADPDLTYSDRVIHSPAVPVFRGDRGEPWARPVPVSFLTAAAPNRGAIERNQPDRLAAVPDALFRRAGRVLDVAQLHGHRRLVLGAWGCGVFRNDPATVARAFAEQLKTPRGFTHVTFAVLDAATFAVFDREVPR
ncbi:TIGR02452 family protein [Dactylosporangium sp. AC04546]|uniref:TIGR02452 family protein n=1 Tax=Dactylosporangium sp. AC04546 TaxID=2862460 RepID=UPI001EDF201F|nr:TIGR02452 family protein [Dactylosporangium sp. AC04546]WVK80256.1 TIGR02452 family protein [Dactylosporangium sp. AC04546]